MDVSINDNNINNTPDSSEGSQNVNSNEFTSMIKDGVEVVDVKVVPSEKDKVKLNKFGIPENKNRPTWNKI